MRKLSSFLLASFACMMFITMQMAPTVFAQGTPGDLPVPAVVGDFVWHDRNENGVQDLDEVGLPNITIHLLQNGTITETTTTDAGGLYLFDELPAGTYTIQVDLSSIPYSGYYFSQPDAGADDVDSDANVFGRIENITLSTDSFDVNLDIGIVLPGGVIGNLVWLDEDGDGDQDPGEPGIANVVVELYDENGDLVAETLSDLDGGYVFKDLFGESYTVRINPNSLPEGARWDEIIAGDFGNQDPDGASVSLVLGQEQMGGDFGIFWGNPRENSGNGALGGRIWSDADGNGLNDPGEPGIGDVIVSLMNTAIGLQRTATTNASGFYLFDALPAGGYTIIVESGDGTPLENSSASFDPDNISRPQLEPNNRTDAPLILAPGDLYAYADFGYKLEGTAAVSGTIVTRIYVDTNGNGQFDEGPRVNGTVTLPALPPGETNDPILVLGDEPGFANVTVSLVNDAGEIVATTRSDGQGVAQFTGLPPGMYTVFVSDVDNVLGEIVPFGEPDQVFDGETLVVLTADETENAEFGYAPAGHDEDDVLFSDFIYFDFNGNGEYDEGEGLEGIIVQLFDEDGVAYPQTLTNENGLFLFGNVQASGRYTIKIDPDSVPAGFINTIDPDGGTPLEAEIVLQNNVLINLAAADFGFTVETGENEVLGSISGNVWNDVNADGILNDFNLGNFGFSEVLVELYLDIDGNGILDQSEGDRLLAVTVTDRAGAFRFDDLSANGVSYLVRVSDQNGSLQNYWSTNGMSPNVNNRSQESPYALELTQDSPTNDTADFGYSRPSGAIGNRVWIDWNNNGVQDQGDETGVPGAVVRLTISYGTQTAIPIEQDASDGFYGFYGLGVDESYFNEGEITYKLTVDYDESEYVPAKIDAISNEWLDSDDPECEYATVTLGQPDLTVQSDAIAETIEASYDFGFVPIDVVNSAPTSVVMKTASVTMYNTLFIIGLFSTLLAISFAHKRKWIE